MRNNTASSTGKKLTAEPKSIDSAACLRCCPMGDNGVFDDNEFNVGTVFVVNRRCTFALSDAVELGPCDCIRTPIGRSGGGTKGSSPGDRREFENVMAIFYRLASRVSMGPECDDRLWIFGHTVAKSLRKVRGRAIQREQRTVYAKGPPRWAVVRTFG